MDIISKDEDIDPIIYKIFNEAYHEFQDRYGSKYSEFIKAKLEKYTEKGMLKRDELGLSDATASATPHGIAYTEADDLSAILKHELWHIYNDVLGKDPEY